MALTNLPIDVLRSFVTVIDLGGFTRAADVLGRSQPAISLQLRKLEALLDCKLIVHVGREMQLTEDGKALAVLARQILELNDQAVGRLERTAFAGAVRVGLPVDYSVGYLQDSVTEFVNERPDQSLEIHCDLSCNLLSRLHHGELDIVVSLFPGGDHQYLFRQWQEEPIWVAAEGWQGRNGDVVPIVTHPEGCEYRKRMISALLEARREWRVAYSSPGIGGLQRAVLNGLGASALTRRTLQPGMRILTPGDGYPSMQLLHIGLFYRLSRLHGAGQEIVSHLVERLESNLLEPQ